MARKIAAYAASAMLIAAPCGQAAACMGSGEPAPVIGSGIAVFLIAGLLLSPVKAWICKLVRLRVFAIIAICAPLVVAAACAGLGMFGVQVPFIIAMVACAVALCGAEATWLSRAKQRPPARAIMALAVLNVLIFGAGYSMKGLMSQMMGCIDTPVAAVPVVKVEDFK